MECRWAQGYYLAMPQDAASLGEVLRTAAGKPTAA
jgi:EAL domain-containing protein (putative c-di-GMP-specific phosphodiesterase class I)